MVARYRTSVVGLIDILGVSARLSDPATAKRYAEAVAAIFKPMIGDKGEWCFVLPHVDEARKIEIFLSPSFSKGSKITFISDSIVVSAPVDGPGEGNAKCAAILACLEAIKALQRSLLMLGLRSRGGISIGGLIHSGELLVGDGLLRAYELERRQAGTPRTIVDPVVIDYLSANAQEHFLNYTNRVAHALRQDEDGQFFVDYLAYCPKDGYCGLGAEFPFILNGIATDLKLKDCRWKAKIEWLWQYTSASYEDCKSERMRPFSHAKSAFAGLFPRTNDTLIGYLESEDELTRTLKLQAAVDSLPRDDDVFRWPLGWKAILTPEYKARLDAELAREICAGHALQGQGANVLGRFELSDEFLFLLEGGRVAQVHLTWNAERYPEWPLTTIYPSFFAWSAETRARASARIISAREKAKA